MDSVITFCAQYLLFIVFLAAAGYWLTLPGEQKISTLVFGVITGVVAILLAKIGGSLFYDARPFVTDHVVPLFTHGNDNGFPSDHTIATSVLAVTFFMVSKKWSATIMAAAVIIGASRVLAHVHHPVDIIGSIVFALLGGLVAYYLTPKVMQHIKWRRQSYHSSSLR